MLEADRRDRALLQTLLTNLQLYAELTEMQSCRDRAIAACIRVSPIRRAGSAEQAGPPALYWMEPKTRVSSVCNAAASTTSM